MYFWKHFNSLGDLFKAFWIQRIANMQLKILVSFHIEKRALIFLRVYETVQGGVKERLVRSIREEFGDMF